MKQNGRLKSKKTAKDTMVSKMRVVRSKDDQREVRVTMDKKELGDKNLLTFINVMVQCALVEIRAGVDITIRETENGYEVIAE